MNSLICGIALVCVSGLGGYALGHDVGKMARCAVLRERVYRLQSMIAGFHNGYGPATTALQREADVIRQSGNDGRGMIYGTEHLYDTVARDA